MMSKLLIAAMMSTALVGTAVAQSSTAPSTSPPSATAPSTTAPSSKADKLASTSTEGDWRATKLVGVNVYNDANEKLGAISDLILDKEGKIAKVVIGVGGFLGMGEHNIAVNYDQLKWVNEPVKTTTSDARSPSAGGAGSMGTGMTGGGSTVGSARSAPAKVWYPDHAVLSGASKDQLKAMPAFNY